MSRNGSKIAEAVAELNEEVKAEAASEAVAEVVTEAEDKGNAEKSSEKSDEKGDLMYLGPTIVGVIRHSTVFKDGVLTKKAQACVEAFPVMERLFVGISQMPAAVKELNKKQSALSSIYAQTAQEFSRR